MTTVPAPGWYADPDNPDQQRYWDGSQWLVPVAPPTTPEPPAAAAAPPLDEKDVEEGWYVDPHEPTVRRYWTGSQLLGIKEPARPTDLVLPLTLADQALARADRSYLRTNYVMAVLIPIWGWGAAIYLAVSEQKRRLRRHALGVAAVSITSAAIYAVVIISLANSHQDRNIGADLRSLLTSHGISASAIQCAHQNGNQYVCSATINGQQQNADVTDDGHTIYESGISAGG